MASLVVPLHPQRLAPTLSNVHESEKTPVGLPASLPSHGRSLRNAKPDFHSTKYYFYKYNYISWKRLVCLLVCL